MVGIHDAAEQLRQSYGWNPAIQTVGVNTASDGRSSIVMWVQHIDRLPLVLTRGTWMGWHLELRTLRGRPVLDPRTGRTPSRLLLIPGVRT